MQIILRSAVGLKSVARQAHNLKATGSIPVPAAKFQGLGDPETVQKYMVEVEIG
jgi:hypothetical protein